MIMRAMAIVIGTLSIPTVALAQAAQPQTPMPADPVTLGNISDLKSEIGLLTQELQVATLKAQIAKDNAAAEAAGGAPADANPVNDGDGDGLGMPSVVSIVGSGAQLTATLQLPQTPQLPEGGQVIASPNMGLPGGLTVYDISASGVRVMSGGNLETLPFATAQSDTPPAPQGGVQQHLPMFRSVPRIPAFSASAGQQ
jgi:type IV pilus biogenesis protein PilP